MNLIRRLALRGGEDLDDSSRLDVVEIARVADMLGELVSSLVGLRTYQHIGIFRRRKCLLNPSPGRAETTRSSNFETSSFIRRTHQILLNQHPTNAPNRCAAAI